LPVVLVSGIVLLSIDEERFSSFELTDSQICHGAWAAPRARRSQPRLMSELDWTSPIAQWTQVTDRCSRRAYRRGCTDQTPLHTSRTTHQSLTQLRPRTLADTTGGTHSAKSGTHCKHPASPLLFTTHRNTARPAHRGRKEPGSSSSSSSSKGARDAHKHGADQKPCEDDTPTYSS
jgi:hypothetical protein